MIHALVLSGGVGSRFGNQIPKQYIEVKSKPIIGYALEVFQNHPLIDKITIVISDSWEQYMMEYMNKANISKFSGFAPSGKSRQHSILSGLKKISSFSESEDDLVVIHDAARPLVSNAIIDNCIRALSVFDMSMPVIPVNDTIYYTENKKEVSHLLNRDCLFAGQAPEGCHLGSYLRINEQMSDNELSAVRGTSEAGFKHGLSIGLFPGEERNFKITVNDDLAKFQSIILEM